MILKLIRYDEDVSGQEGKEQEQEQEQEQEGYCFF